MGTTRTWVRRSPLIENLWILNQCEIRCEDGLIVEHAANAREGLSMAELGSFDALILDVMLPEGDNAGFEIARTLRDARNPVPILVLTARGDMDAKLSGLEVGGDDHLTKPFDFRERRASGQVSNTVPLPLGHRLDLTAHEVTKGDQAISLTPRGCALVSNFALDAGRAYSCKSLIERV